MRLSSRFLAGAAARYDAVVVGGRILGAATARQLKIARPNLSVALVEKEKALAHHQSGHNSGVIHAGIYYEPGSLMAKLCVEGIDLMYGFLDEKKIPYKKCGKLIVAVDQAEVPHLEKLYERAQRNACREIRLVDAEMIRQMQPSCRGVTALHSPHTGIVDFAEVTRAMASDFEDKGGDVLLEHQLIAIRPSSDPKHCIELNFAGAKKPILTSYAVTCAGLHSDRVAQLSGCASTPKIIPFRGDYLQLKADKRHLVSMCIYPVPDPRLPFLGVHFTPTMKGEVICGPSAVLAFKREDYNFIDISPRDLLESVTYSGMIRLLSTYTRYGIGEFYRALNTTAQVKRLRRLVPDISRSDVEKGVSGVRAQALGRDGRLIEDFVFDSGIGEIGSRVLHVRNAPSPGATSSLAISKMIVAKAQAMFDI